MKILLPDNIYAKIFFSLLPGFTEAEIIYSKSAVISKELDEDKADIARIPSMDILSHPAFYISGKAAISFDGAVSNSYFYFIKQLRFVKELFLRGDVSKNEVILSKIIFEEQFDSTPEIFLDSKEFSLNEKNYLICGNENFTDNLLDAGFSLADQIADMLEAPYVNYVLASKNEQIIKNLNTKIADLDKMLEDNFEAVSKNLNVGEHVLSFVRDNLNSLYFDMTEIERKSFADLIQLAYFAGIIEDIPDIKLID